LSADDKQELFFQQIDAYNREKTAFLKEQEAAAGQEGGQEAAKPVRE